MAAEKLREDHGIAVGRETLRQWMIEAGLWRDRKQRKQVHQPRPRRKCVGELVQVDGSEHWWFEDRGPQPTLLVFIDDATSRLMHLQFVESKSTFAYFHAARAYLEACCAGSMAASNCSIGSLCHLSSENVGEGSQPHIPALAVELEPEHPRFGTGCRDAKVEIHCWSRADDIKGRKISWGQRWVHQSENCRRLWPPTAGDLAKAVIPPDIRASMARR